MKLTLALIIALTVSAGLNVYQVVAGAVDRNQCEADAELAREQGRAAAMARRLDVVVDLATQKLEDDAELRDLRASLATREVEVRTVYRDRIREVEVPACRVAPGQVNAINEVLR